MDENFDEDSVPFLYVDESGFLAIGQGMVIDELNAPILESLVKKLQNVPVQKLRNPTPDLVSEFDMDRAMNDPEIRILEETLASFPFQASVGEIVKGGSSGEMFVIIKQEVPLTEEDKKLRIEQTLDVLIRKSIILKAQRDRLGSHFDPPPPEAYYKSGDLVLSRDLIDRVQVESEPSLGEEGASLVLDFTPFVGSAKSVAQLVTGEDLVTGERVSRWGEAAGILLGLIPFGKLLTKSRKARKLYHLATIKKPGSRFALAKIKREEILAKRTKQLMKGKEPGFNFNPHEMAYKYPRNNSGGKYGTFLTDQQHIERSIGKIDMKKSVIEITPEQAEHLAQNLGLADSSVAKYGGVLSVVDKVHLRKPKIPTGGNPKFKMGKGLKRAGPEVTVSSINNTSIEPTVRQIEIRIKGLTEAQKKARAREMRKAISK